jgi:mono/diheme cytochrome c family protein
MISARMSRAVKVLFALGATVAVAALASACGTEQIRVSKATGPLYTGAVLFNQRCSGCHTLSFAATHGSAARVQTAQYNNGPNFDVRCERPVTRVLYAIENGGFSGAIMPQNVVVGQQAVDVAEFVATYAGRQAPKVPGVTACQRQSVGSIPAPATTATTSTSTTSTSTTAATATTKTTTSAHGKTVKPRHKTKRKP